jgi:predicted NACHT family NTPase
LLRKIAAFLHGEKIRDISRVRLEEYLVPEIVKQMPLSKAAHLEPHLIIKNIEERSQLLVERGLDASGKPVMAFSHLTFQEYLTSSSIHSSMSGLGRGVVFEELLKRYKHDPEWWQEVAVLFAAQLDGPDQASFLNALKLESQRVSKSDE